MENLNKSPEQQIQMNSGVQSLTNMPSFAEKQAKQEKYRQEFEAARRSGTLPEGVHDDYEYREYMEAKNAHAAEAAERDKTLFSEIEQIKDPFDRDLAKAIVGYFSFDREKDDSKEAIGNISEYCHSEKELPLSTFLSKKKDEYGLSGRYNNLDLSEDAWGPDERFVQISAYLSAGNAVARELDSDAGKEDLLVGLHRLHVMPDKGDVSDDTRIDQAAQRAIAKNILSKYEYTDPTDIKLGEDDEYTIIAFEKSFGKLDQFAWRELERASRIAERAKPGYADKITDIVSSLVNIHDNLNTVKESYDDYKFYLQRGQSIIAESK